MKYKRFLSFIVLSFFLINSSIVNASSAVKIGQSCTKNHEIKKQGWTTFICTRIDSKLTWQVSVAQIQENIWRDLQKKRNLLPEVSTSLQVHYSSTANMKSSALILNSLNQAARLWQVQYLPSEPLPTLFFTEKDRSWFINSMNEIGVYSENQLSNFDDEVKRNGDRGNWAGVTGDGGKIWMTYMIGTGRNTFDPNDLQVAAHEYTHLVQNAISPQQFSACWQIEGGAAFYGLYLGASSIKQLNEFIKFRDREKYFYGFDGLIKQSPKNFGNLIDQFGPNYDSRQCGPDGAYSIGNVMHEYLYSLKGHEGIIDMLKNVASAKDFTSGMEKTYQKSWIALRSELIKYLKITIAQSN